MVNMARKIHRGLYQIGIYEVRHIGRGIWRAVATGPGTIGDGGPQVFRSLADARLTLTGEPI